MNWRGRNLNSALPPEYRCHNQQLEVANGKSFHFLSKLGIENFNAKKCTSILYESLYFDGSATDVEDESILSQLDESYPKRVESAATTGVREACLA